MDSQSTQGFWNVSSDGLPLESRNQTREYVEILMKLPAADRSRVMCREKMRLRTYGSLWPLSDVIAPRDLAGACFYYTGIADRVQCAVCRGVLRNWKVGDVAWDEHRKHYGFCRFITNQDASNVPHATDNGPLIELKDLQTMLTVASAPSRGSGNIPPLSCYSTAVPPRVLQLMPGIFSAASNSCPSTRRNQDVVAPDTETLSNVISQNSDMCEISRRMATYETCGHSASPSQGWTDTLRPEDMATAGFYMTGVLDEVKCFDCGLCLSHWKAGDSPLKEHIKFSHMCTYANSIRSQIQAGRDPLPLVPTGTKDTTTADSTTGVEKPSIYEGRCSTQSVATRSQIQGKNLTSVSLKLVGQLLPAFDCSECHRVCANTVNMPCGHIDACQKCVAIRRKTAVVAMNTAEHWESGNSAQLGECSLCSCGIRNFFIP